MPAQRTMKEAVSEGDFEIWDKGGKLPKKVTPSPLEPTPPKIDKVIRFDKIKLDELEGAPSSKIKTVRNDDGVMFIGFDISLEMKDGKRITGWMPEADYTEFRRIVTREGKINTDNMVQ